jgi:hypothetical protein
MSARLLLLVDALLIALAAVLGASLYDAWTSAPPPPAPEQAVAPAAEAPPPPDAPATRRPLSAYAVVAERNLFSPTRSEVAAEPPRPVTAQAGGPPAPPAPKPRLHGIVLLPDGNGRAYLEDVQRRRVLAYSVGDSVAGSRVEQIRPDRVVLRRGTETFEVLLHDPTKPRPPAPRPGVQSPAGRPPGPAGATPPAVGAVPGRPPIRLPVRPRPPAAPAEASPPPPAEVPQTDEQQQQQPPTDDEE